MANSITPLATSITKNRAVLVVHLDQPAQGQASMAALSEVALMAALFDGPLRRAIEEAGSLRVALADDVVELREIVYPDYPLGNRQMVEWIGIDPETGLTALSITSAGGYMNLALRLEYVRPSHR
jgi:hypothetical protein